MGHLLGGKGDDHPPRLAQTQIGSDLSLRTTIAERGTGGVSVPESRLARNLSSVMETIQTAQHTQAVIDSLGSRLGWVLQLVVDILQQKGLGELGQRVAFGLEPSCRVSEVKGIGAQRSQGELAQFLGSKERDGPSGVAA